MIKSEWTQPAARSYVVMCNDTAAAGACGA